jgi:hypothetical protein
MQYVQCGESLQSYNLIAKDLSLYCMICSMLAGYGRVQGVHHGINHITSLDVTIHGGMGFPIL